jgi:anti-sigma regulatory factor (Ser/Thr protein kinase)
MVLPVDRSAASQARAAIDDAIPPPSLDGRSEDPRLAVTEIVSNAVRHAGLEPGEALIHLVIEADDDHVRVEVEQPTPADGVHLVEQPGVAERPGGYGLHLVEASADEWGYDPGPPGRVWFEFRP